MIRYTSTIRIVLANLSEHAGKIYALTGAEAIRQMAAIFTEASGREIQHIDLTVEEYKKALEQYGVPDFVYNFMGCFNTTVKEGQWEKATDDINVLTGKSARTFKEFVIENKTVFI